MHSNPNTYGMTTTEKVKSKIPGTMEHKMTHPTTGMGVGTAQPAMMSGPGTVVQEPMMGGRTGLAHSTVGPAVPGAIGTHHTHGVAHTHHTHGSHMGTGTSMMGHHHGQAPGSTAGMSATQKIASKVPGTTEYKMTH